MVRIQRNDAPPRPKVNLVSDDEKAFSKSPARESSSSSSAESSSSSDCGAPATPSPLSDFIEEDDSSQPLPKSSSSSWEPLKRRRRRIRTLRKRPKFDTVDADEEESTSTTSTSSEGIPTPDVEADADDEEGQGEAPSPVPSTPSKRKRPRRAAAPKCFLDALNKYVEPMSKEASKYTKRTMCEIWHGESDKEDSGEASNDSSVEYVPYHSGQPEDEATEEEDEGDTEELAEDDNQHSESSTASLTIRQKLVRRADPCRNASSDVVYSGDKRGAERKGAVRLRNNEKSHDHHRSLRSNEQRRSFIDLSDTYEDIRLSTVLEKKQEPLHVQEETFSALPRSETVNLETANTSSRRPKGETEIIDLCNDDKYVVPVVSIIDDEPAHPKTETIQDKSNYIKRGLPVRNVNREEQEHGRAQRNFRRGHDREHHVSRHKTTAISKTEDCSPSRKRSALSDFACNDDAPALQTAARDVVHKENARLAAALTHIGNPRRDSHRAVPEISRGTSVMIKNESSLQEHRVGTEIEHGIKPRKEDNKSRWEGKEQKPTDGVGEACYTRTNERRPVSLGLKHTRFNSTPGEQRAIRRFEGAKQRGRTPHPDRVHDRVPRTDGEQQAWLKFIKAEARDIHRAFSAEPPARRFKCATTDVTFVRQVLAALGKIMGLTVRSERDGAGRRIILERSPFGIVGGSERDVEEAVEGFFYDALADLTDQGEDKRNVHEEIRSGGDKEDPCGYRDEKAKMERKEEDKSFVTPTRSSRSKEKNGDQRSRRKSDRVRIKQEQNKRGRRDDPNHRSSTETHSHTQKKRRNR